jgi:hypothetical protein
VVSNSAFPITPFVFNDIPAFLRVTTFVFYNIPASPRALEERPFVFNDIPALLFYFLVFHRFRSLRVLRHIFAFKDLLDVLHPRAIVLTRRGDWRVGRFIPKPQQYRHFAVDGAAQGALLAVASVLLGGGAARSGGMLGILARGGEQRGRKLG